MKKKLIISTLVSGLLFFAYFYIELRMPVRFAKDEVEVYIAKGTSFKGAVNKLVNEGVLRRFSLIYFAGKFKGFDRRMKVGFYKFKSGQSPLSIIETLGLGDTVKIKVSVVPGETLRDIARKFGEVNKTEEIKDSTKLSEDFLKQSNDTDLLKSLNVKAPSLEGYLYPDTYVIEKGISSKDALNTMVSNLRKHYPPDFKEKASAIGMTENQVLTLASIIEKEAKLDSERFQISAVYQNRLKMQMQLQADPTAIYGVKSYKEGVTKSDLKNVTPYNTYKIYGLPPGPIAMPNQRSIQAALEPADVPYLYFVAKGDGSHRFSETYEEHLINVDKYRNTINKSAAEATQIEPAPDTKKQQHMKITKKRKTGKVHSKKKISKKSAHKRKRR
ncbi:MAG: endolytic transglycosylase MltG [Nitrospirae bacterium]|nr:endolytic transglycosylase MltG [Nitrospirota bacterium]MBF0534806.1 endolytic transglycosylase MltG [Nitrospirota bacterium]MBF0616480.1 endolytic transglycosylase MltG [Nitrospirota bacterium]